MRNPFRALLEWRRREMERVDALGGWRLFWYYMTLGLLWSLWMFAGTTAIDLLTGDTPRYLSLQDRMTINFGGGMLFGFVTWLIHTPRRAGRPSARR